MQVRHQRDVGVVVPGGAGASDRGVQRGDGPPLPLFGEGLQKAHGRRVGGRGKPVLKEAAGEWEWPLNEPLMPPLCDIPSGCCSFMGPWTLTRSSLRMLRRVAAFCRPLRPVLLLVSFPRSRSPPPPG